jgi:methylated-DNA-[protein]-cysteine S-methyltransferase
MGRLTVDSPIGRLTLSSRNGVLTGLSWGSQSDGEPDAIVERAAEQLAEYFDGKRTDFDLPLETGGSAFQKRVWAAMRAIPPGRTRSYGDVARSLDSAPRAVGGACGKNPIVIVVPCHRIVGSAGLGGFGGRERRLDIKSWLLDHERRYWA